jgi:NAD(P)H-quinone oxidoreductase subunit K
MFSTDSYSTVRGVDKLIPVDIYLPGCPPKPEAIIDAIIKLRKKIAQETYKDQSKIQQGKRYLTLNHKFKSIPTINIAQDNKQVYPQTQFNSTLESFVLTEKKDLAFLLKNEASKKNIQNK